EEEALTKLKQKIELPDEVTITSAKLNETGVSGKQVWEFRFEYHYQNGSAGWTGGQIDAQTGEVLLFDMSHYVQEKMKRSPSEDKSNYELAKQQAISFVKEKSKDKLHELYPQQLPMNTVGPI